MTKPPAPFDRRPWLDQKLPDEAARVPTMLTEEEGQLLYWLTGTYATGAGVICDLGCFAGGSTGWSLCSPPCLEIIFLPLIRLYLKVFRKN